ncbi:GNAT family N-acetyltransferase [Natrialbaceae archaeon A-arb3/5]
MAVYVRTATSDDALTVRRILDAAMLEPGDVEARISYGDVLVAGDRRGGTRTSERANGSTSDAAATSERVLGALVLDSLDEDGSHVSAIGVRRRHRNRGIGRALIERALEREGKLTARFDERVRPFYESLDFAIEPIDGKRHRGTAVAADRERRRG